MVAIRTLDPEIPADRRGALACLQRSMPRRAYAATQVNRLAESAARWPADALVAVGETGIVGYAECTRPIPTLQWARLCVDPSHRGQGVGHALALAACELIVKRHQPTYVDVDAEDVRSTGFATRWGLQPPTPEAPSSYFLDLRRSHSIGSSGPPGLTVCQATPNENRFREAVALLVNHHSDVYKADTLGQAVANESARVNDDGAIVLMGILDDSVAGVTIASPLPGTGRIYSDYTVVDPAYRGLGVAAALKVAQARWAAHTGASEIVTDVPSSSPAMASVLKRVGYLSWDRRAWIIPADGGAAAVASARTAHPS